MDDAAVTAVVLGPDFRRATFAGKPRGAPLPWVRVTVRPVEVRGERLLQFGYFDGKKTLTKNNAPADAGPPLAELLAARFAGVHLTTAAEEIDLRTTKKGAVTVGRAAGLNPAAPATHNRTKDVPLPEGRPDRLLTVMGVATPDGRVKPTMRGKFTQINEFLKHLSHALQAADLLTVGRPLDLLDCGCGASYLTLAAHHYLNHVRGVPARLVGVDVNDEMVRKSLVKADALGAAGLTFACGRIGTVDVPADVVIALHACDTATDDALIQAVRSNAKLILAAPCCHQHLNRQMPAAGPLRGLLRHGILRERQADLVTDALRAAALRAMGYRAEVVEFVGLEHTARNLLLRAVKVGEPGRPEAVAEYEALKAFWGVEPYLDRLLPQTSPPGPLSEAERGASG
jgi:SAM-dependent methyltransferase